MTVETFDRDFPAFSDVGTTQAYDSAEGAEAAFEAFKQTYSTELGERALSPEEKGAATTKARALVGHLNAALEAFVTSIMPPESVTANADYVVEDSFGVRVALQDQIKRLRAEPSQEHAPAPLFRISNTTLEQNFQALLDHLTASRIAEERDAPTYIERLRGAFKRARDGAQSQGAKFEPHHQRSQLISGRMSVVRHVVAFLKSDVLPKLESTEDSENPEAVDLKRDIEQLDTFATNSSAFNTHFRHFLDLSDTSLTRVSREFASDANMAGAEGESTLVSWEIERHAFFRPLPLLWAVIVTLLVKSVLAHNTSETLHYQAVPLLFLSFLITWIFSISIGIWARTRRMKELQTHIRNQLLGVLQASNADEELVEFPFVPADHQITNPTPIKPFAFRGNAPRHKRRVALQNLWALVIPAILAVAVLITRKDVDHDFIARFPDSEACVLASGRMVFATPNSYFVKASGAEPTPYEWALARVFPELMADVVERSHIISIREYRSTPSIAPSQSPADGIAEQSLLDADAGERGLADCVSAELVRDSLTIVNDGRTVGQFDSQETINAITEQTQNLITALGTPRPLFLDFGDGGTGDNASVTVNLGDTSLDVLTQAILDAGDSAPIISNPVIIDARTAIELELSKQNPNDIDLSVILNALNTVRVEVGEDITFAEALALVIGGAGVTEPVTVNLGDTSLDVLSQAILRGGDTTTTIVDPVIVDARTAIELELSKPNPNDVDVSVVLNALETIRLQLGDDVTIVQALNVIFGGATTPVTVNLGDTSLDVLTQAIVSGGTTPAPVIDPVIVDARTIIELELSKQDPETIDLPLILAALNNIRVQLGEDVTFAETLNFIFGGRASASATLELPDNVLMFLGGDDGETGLPGELRALRIALEASNEMAAKLTAALETGDAGDTMVTVLNENLASIVERHDQLIAALTTRLAAEGNDAIVVTPTIFRPGGSGGGDPDAGEVSANIFQTTIELAATGTTLNTLGNTLVLPFFTAPVETGTGALATPQGAFDWGADTGNLTDPVVTDDDKSYFGRISETLESCLIDNATVEIDMIGLASPSWDGPTAPFTQETLNYYLAEGRRVGALKRLGELMENDSLEDRVLVQLTDGSTLSMTKIIKLAAADTPIEDALPSFGRFESRSSFENRRDTLLAVTGLNPDVESPLEELFARSVVLRMVETNGGPCQF